MNGAPGRGRVTAASLRRMKARGERIAMLTAYDFPTARLFDAAGADVLLVGDSLGMMVLGYESTIPVTVEDILHHTRAVVRGTKHALVVADLPFMSYTISREQAMANAARLIQDGGAQAVKLEGGQVVAPTVRALVESGIPAMGHIGLTPQSVHRFGGYRVQGRDRVAARRLLEEAQALEAAGACAIVLELVPAPLAGRISEALKIPTIGIGAGPQCDGQVQVMHDFLGWQLPGEFVPRHAKRFANLGAAMLEAAGQYIGEVRAGTFPTEAQSFTMEEHVLAALAATEAGGPKRTGDAGDEGEAPEVKRDAEGTGAPEREKDGKRPERRMTERTGAAPA